MKIKAVSVAHNVAHNSIVVADTEGRVWEQYGADGLWRIVELPEAPDTGPAVGSTHNQDKE